MTGSMIIAKMIIWQRILSDTSSRTADSGFIKKNIRFHVEYSYRMRRCSQSVHPRQRQRLG